jgi:fatty acid desaturase
VSIFLFGFTQIVIGWVGHSMAHNRHPIFMKYGSIPAGLIGGFSLSWWSPKHNMHHIFTNSQLYDEDIQHEYKVYLYEFLYLKWRFDSFVEAIKNNQYVSLSLISERSSLHFGKLHHSFLFLPKLAILCYRIITSWILFSFRPHRKPRKRAQI